MIKIKIDGIIGLDTLAKDVIAQIDKAGGRDIEVEINSPGGSVTEGLAIYNALMSHTGTKTVVINALAASMASYIAMAGDTIKVYDNSILVVHNVQGVAMGDYREMRKTGEILESMTAVLAKGYITRTNLTPLEVTALMDADTYLYGQEIVAKGFASAVIQSPIKINRTDAVARSRLMVACCYKLPDTAQAAAISIIEETKALSENEIREAGIQEGIKQERKRWTDLKRFSGYTTEADKAVDEAIASGASLADCTAQLTAAVAARATLGENPPEVVTAAAVTFSAEEVLAMKRFNMSEGDWLKYGRAQ